MKEKLLWWLTASLPMRVINDGTRPYLERYYLGTLLGWRFYIHRFVGSDPDRGLHDHPWTKAYSIILSGDYLEQTRSGWRKVRWFNSLTGDTFHRVVMRIDGYGNDNPCWTLFLHRVGNAKPWGFLHPFPMHGDEGAQIFTPYTYAREGRQENWWLTAPKRGEK